MPKHLTLLYSPRVGQTVPDLELDRWFEELILHIDDPFRQVGSELMILRARVGLVDGEIDRLTVRYEGVDHEADSSSKLLTFWAVSPDVHMDLLMKVIDHDSD